MMSGTECGSRSFHSTCSREAFDISNNSSRLRSTDNRPAVLAVIIGNRLITSATTTTLVNPKPNHKITSGASATLGTVCRKMA